MAVHPGWDFAIVAVALPVIVVGSLPVQAGAVIAAIVALKVRLARADRARAEGRWQEGVGSKMNQVLALGLVLSVASSWAARVLFG